MGITSTVPPEFEHALAQIQQQIKQADELEHARRVDEALAAYQACLDDAARNHSPMTGDMLAQIWLGMGFCHADRDDWMGALEWYHRAEAVTLSTPQFNPDLQSTQVQDNAQRWTPFVPDGINVLSLPWDMAQSDLATLYDSMALAYDNSNQPMWAARYYDRSADIFIALADTAREAKTWMHQAIGYQRRQEWFNLEVVGYKYLRACERLDDKPQMLTARRWLAQSQVNQQRLFTALEHLGQAVLLGRELNDPNTGPDEKTLGDMFHSVRARVIATGHVEPLQMLVKAETIAGSPTLEEDSALLATQMQAQTSSLLAGAEPEGPIASLEEAGAILERFALRHCGPSQPAPKGAAGLFSGRRAERAKSPERHAWEVTRQEMDLYRKNEHGERVHVSEPCMSLKFAGRPEVVISVFLNPPTCDVVLMQEINIPSRGDTGFTTVSRKTVQSRHELLQDCLNGLILQGLFVKTSAGLRYEGLPKST